MVKTAPDKSLSSEIPCGMPQVAALRFILAFKVIYRIDELPITTVTLNQPGRI